MKHVDDNVTQYVFFSFEWYLHFNVDSFLWPEEYHAQTIAPNVFINVQNVKCQLYNTILNDIKWCDDVTLGNFYCQMANAFINEATMLAHGYFEVAIWKCWEHTKSNYLWMNSFSLDKFIRFCSICCGCLTCLLWLLKKLFVSLLHLSRMKSQATNYLNWFAISNVKEKFNKNRIISIW